MIRQIHLDVCDSTQDVLKEQTIVGNESLLISTNSQLKGRGRGNNEWQEFPGTLCFSLTIAPHVKMSFTALEISLLVVRFFEFEGCKLKLKWPNDLWDSRGRKCGGILVQGSSDRLMAGIGLNLYSDGEFGGVYQESFEFDKKSWSLRIAEFILSHRYPDTESLKQDWAMRCAHLGSEVRITEGDMISEGKFRGIGPSGEAILMTVEGEKSFFNGSLRVIESGR